VAVEEIPSLESATQLHSWAEDWRHREGTVRSPLVLLQALALAREFTCLHPLPTKRKPGKAKLTAYGQDMRAHGERVGATTGKPLGQSDLQQPTVLLLTCCLPRCCFALLPVWAFYEQELKHKWRGQLVWGLFQLQQLGAADSLHQV